MTEPEERQRSGLEGPSPLSGKGGLPMADTPASPAPLRRAPRRRPAGRRVRSRTARPRAGRLDLIQLPDGSDVEDEAVDALTAQAAIGRIVEILPADQAEVVLLRVLAGLSAEDTGELMGKRPGTIRVLQHRALDRLAREFTEAAVTRPPSQAM